METSQDGLLSPSRLKTVFCTLEYSNLADGSRCEQVDHLRKHIAALELDRNAACAERDAWKAAANRSGCHSCFPPEKEMVE